MRTSERRALAWAAAGHVALAAALSLGWSRMAETQPVPPGIAVDLELAEAGGGGAPAAAAPAPAAAAPEPLPEAQPEPPAPEEAQPLAPEPQEVVEPEPEPVAEPAPQPTPARREQPPRPERRPPPRAEPIGRTERPAQARPAEPDARELAAALDRALARPAPAAREARPAPGPDAGRGPGATAAARPGPAGGGGLSPDALASLAAAIKAQVTRCWNPPVGQARPSTVTLRLQLARDGSLARPPEIVAQTGETDPALRRPFDESARRAVLQCAPLRLPAEMYDAWRDVELNFDPRDLA
jgi:outer membrane biosynthesis protein TonB